MIGDFNINLLQTNEHEKFNESFDMMWAISFSPQITLSARYGIHSCSLIDQMFCKAPLKQTIDFCLLIIIM